MTHVPEPDATGTCAVCQRPTATYSGVLQHRRGGARPQLTDQPRRLSRADVVAALPTRVDAVEERLAGVEVAIAALSALAAELRADIQAWTQRQPIYVEMRPRHERVADGGEGGQRERKRLRAVIPA